MIDETKVLQFPYRGAPQTINVMRRAALESQTKMVLRNFVEQTCRDLDSKDYLSEYLAVYYRYLQVTRYMRDPRTVELVRAPYVIAEDILKGGTPQLDCDDGACFLAGSCMMLGATCRYATSAFRDIWFVEPDTGIRRRQYSHVWSEAFEPRSKQWIILDPVAADRTGQMKRDLKAVKYWVI